MSKVLIVVRVKDVDDKVEMKVELKFLGYEVSSQHFLRDQHLPGFEKLVFLASVKRRAKLVQQSFRIVIQSKTRINQSLLSEH